MELKKGYKQTEVGVIPEDWEVKKLGEFVKITSGESPSRFMFSDDGTPYFKVEQLNNGNKYLFDTPYHSEFRSTVPKGSLIFPKRGASILLNKIRILVEDSFMDTNLMTLTLSEGVDNEFMFYALLHKELWRIADTTSIPQINNKHIIPFQIPLPSTKAEQTAIAAALSDADVMIQSLEKLIAKKRLLKQGAMQELLTGKKRLAGFEGDWQEYELNELGIFKGGSGFPTKYQGLIEGKFPFYKVSDMNIEGNEVFMSNSNNYINEDIKKLTNTFTFPENTIVFAKIGAAVFLERKKILTQESCIDNNMMGFTLNATKCDINFFHSLFLSVKLSKLVSTTALPSLNGKEIGQLKFKIPKPEEQTAIATILADMDAEISALETKLSKYKLIKQGMMQNLLTGKIRLV